LDVETGNGNIIRTNHLADFAVIAKFKPIRRDELPFLTKAVGIRTRKLGAREKSRGMEHRAVSIANGAFNALVRAGSHKGVL